MHDESCRHSLDCIVNAANPVQTSAFGGFDAVAPVIDMTCRDFRTRARSKWAWIMVAATLLAGCGSDGESGQATTPLPRDGTGGTPPTGVPPAELEFGRSNSAVAARAEAAYQQGITGRGVVLAFIDTGINAGLSEFRGRIDSSSADLRGDRGIVDPHGHGTSVAAIATAARDGSAMHGLAFEATILSLNVSLPDCTPAECGLSENAIIRALDAAVAGRARIVNMSLGSDFTSPEILEAVRRVVEAGLLLVVSAGNNGADQPRTLARTIVDVAGDRIIVVGAHDQAGRQYSSGNRAGNGASATRYLTALGVGVSTIDGNGTPVTLDGTSLATAAVSGAAALVWHARPQLSAAQVADLVLSGAADLGEPGTDAVFGRGMLDVRSSFALMAGQR